MKDMGLIQKIAWSFHRTTGLPIDELIGEASLAYAEALPAYNAEKARVSTYMFPRIKHSLINYCRKQKKYKHEPLPDDEEGKTPLPDLVTADPERRTIFKQRIQNGSEELKYLTWTIFQSPEEFLGCGGRTKLKNRLRTEGWPWSMIWETFTEVKVLLREMA